MTLRRNRAAAIAAAFVLLALTGATIVSSAMYFRAENAHAETAVERDDAIDARDHAQAVEAFLTNLLTDAAPESPDDEIAFREVLDEASRMIGDADSGWPPLTEAAIRMVLVRAYERQQLHALAVPHEVAAAALYERELGPDARRTLEIREQVIGDVYSGGGNLADWTDYAAETLERCRRAYAPDDPLLYSATLAWAMAEQSVEGWRRAWEVRIAFHGENSRQAHFGQLVYGMALSGTGGRPKAGRPLQEEALAFFVDGEYRGSENPARQLLAWTYNLLGLFPDAESTLNGLQPWLEAGRTSHAPPHWQTWQAALFQSWAIHGQGRLDEAEALLRSDLVRARSQLGDEHWVTLDMLGLLADILHETGRVHEAKILLATPARSWKKDVLRASVLADAGDLEQAQGVAEAAIPELPNDHGNGRRLDIAEVFAACGRLGDAREQLVIAMRYYDETCETAHPHRARARRLLGALEAAQGELAAAEATLDEALRIDLEWRGPDHRETAKSRLALGHFLLESGRGDEARVELLEARQILERSPFPEDLWLPRVEAALTRSEDG